MVVMVVVGLWFPICFLDSDVFFASKGIVQVEELLDA